MLKPLFALSFAAASALLVAAAPPAQADTVAEKPRLAIELRDAPAGFEQTLKTELDKTRRFVLVEASQAKSKLDQARIKLDGTISVRDAQQAAKLTGSDILLEGVYANPGGGAAMRVVTRLYDFRSGEFSRDLSLIGEDGSAETLARQLAGFIRSSVPLQCLVRDLAEDQVVMDLGAADGVKEGALFRVYRHPLNVRPQEIGLVRVRKVQPFAALADVEESAKGVSLQKGDMLVEQTSDWLFK